MAGKSLFDWLSNNTRKPTKEGKSKMRTNTRKFRLALTALTLLALLSVFGAVLVRAQMTWYVDHHTCPAVGDGSEGTPFCSIQYAIDQASSGDTILVYPGTYDEFISISGKTDLTIQSTHGAANTIIDVGSRGTYVSPSGVIEVRANGLTLDGFTIQNASGGEVSNYVFAGIYFHSGVGCTFKNLVIKNIQGTRRAEGIHFGGDASTFSNITISDLTELPGGTGDAGAFGLIANGADNNTFTDITISNLVSYGGGNACGLITFNSFSNNRFTNMVIKDLTSYGTSASDGILLLSYWHSLDVVNNTFTDTTILNMNADEGRAGGIRSAASSDKKIIGTKFIDTSINNINSNVEAYGIYNSESEGTIITGGEIQGLTAPTTHGINILGSTSTANIEGMTISGANYGISISSAVDASQISAHYNCIAGNADFGAKNHATTVANAENNWWGDASGPWHSTKNPDGTGDAVTDYVAYDPWLTGLSYTGETVFPNADPVVLEATLAGSAGGVADANVYFYVDDARVGSASTDGDGVARLDIGIKDAGVYAVKARAAGCLVAEALVAVYDPTAGFVTGGGWIYSDPGAYVPDPDLEGKATFGFVSKYKKGANVPTGNTEFNFKAGGLNFHSDEYQWLVVNQGGTNAQYKGSGTVNGAGAYKFMLWAGDGDAKNPPESDTFRIKIWWEEDDTEHVVYDNGFDQAIAGGQIVIHTSKK